MIATLLSDWNRVELFGASSEDYERLHANMDAKVQKFADPLSPAKPAAIFAGEIKDGEWSAFLYLA